MEQYEEDVLELAKIIEEINEKRENLPKDEYLLWMDGVRDKLFNQMQNTDAEYTT